VATLFCCWLCFFRLVVCLVGCVCGELVVKAARWGMCRSPLCVGCWLLFLTLGVWRVGGESSARLARHGRLKIFYVLVLNRGLWGRGKLGGASGFNGLPGPKPAPQIPSWWLPLCRMSVRASESLAHRCVMGWWGGASGRSIRRQQHRRDARQHRYIVDRPTDHTHSQAGRQAGRQSIVVICVGGSPCSGWPCACALGCLLPPSLAACCCSLKNAARLRVPPRVCVCAEPVLSQSSSWLPCFDWVDKQEIQLDVRG
jgi:hypothetical protein